MTKVSDSQRLQTSSALQLPPNAPGMPGPTQTAPPVQKKENSKSTQGAQQNAAGHLNDNKMQSTLIEARLRGITDQSKRMQQSGQIPQKNATNAPNMSGAVFDPDGQGRISRNYDPGKSIDITQDSGFKALPQDINEKLIGTLKNSGTQISLQKLLHHPTYETLSPTQKSKLLHVFTECGPKGREELLPLMSRQVNIGSGNSPSQISALLSEDNAKGEKANLLDHLHQMATQKMVPEIADRRKELLNSVIQETARPSYRVDQGNSTTCAPAAVEFHLLKNSPAEYARILNGLASPDKSLILADGTRLHAALNQSNKFTERGRDTRSLSDRMFQGAIIGLGSRLHEGTEYRHDANKEWVGVSDMEVAHAMQSLYNRKFVTFPAQDGISNTSSDPETQKKLRAELFEKMKMEVESHNGPIIAGMNWNARGGHMVLVDRIDQEKGLIYYWNPHGSEGNRPKIKDGMELKDGPVRKMHDSHAGMEVMTIDEFKKYVDGGIFGPPVGG